MVRYGLNIAAEVDFSDPITLDAYKGTVEEYIAEDPDNIAIMYDKNTMFLTKRSTIETQYESTENRFFGCYNEDTAIMPRHENVNQFNIYFSLRSIGLISDANYCDLNEFVTHTENQLFFLHQRRLTYPSYTSLAVMDGGEVVSALHCQAGHKTATSALMVARPSTKDNVEPLQEEGEPEMAERPEAATASIDSDLEMSALIGDYNSGEDMTPENVTTLREPGMSPIEGISDVYVPVTPEGSLPDWQPNSPPYSPIDTPPPLRLSDLEDSQGGAKRSRRVSRTSRGSRRGTLKKYGKRSGKKGK